VDRIFPTDGSHGFLPFVGSRVPTSDARLSVTCLIRSGRRARRQWAVVSRRQSHPARLTCIIASAGGQMSKELRARPPSRAPRRNGRDAPWPAGRFARAPARKFSRAGSCEKEKSLYLFTIPRPGAARRRDRSGEGVRLFWRSVAWGKILLFFRLQPIEKSRFEK